MGVRARSAARCKAATRREEQDGPAGSTHTPRHTMTGVRTLMHCQGGGAPSAAAGAFRSSYRVEVWKRASCGGTRGPEDDGCFSSRTCVADGARSLLEHDITSKLERVGRGGGLSKVDVDSGNRTSGSQYWLCPLCRVPILNRLRGASGRLQGSPEDQSRLRFKRRLLTSGAKNGSGRNSLVVPVYRCMNWRKNRSPKRKMQSHATLAKCREIELASPGNAELQDKQECSISPENEQERQLKLTTNCHQDVKRFAHRRAFARFGCPPACL